MFVYIDLYVREKLFNEDNYTKNDTIEGNNENKFENKIERR